MGTSDQIQHRAEELNFCAPVPDLISAEERVKLLEIYRYLDERNYFDVMKRHFLSGYIKNNVLVSGIWSHWKSEHRRLCHEIALRYLNQPLAVVQMTVIKKGTEATKHIDLHPLRRCLISIPLTQSDSPLNFYENEDAIDPVLSINYETPMLLNIGENYHSVPYCTEDRVMLQILSGISYREMKARLKAV